LDSSINSQIFNLDYLAVIEVSGADSAKFLQGQLTCNVNDLSDSQASIAAFCTAKGRVISSLIIIKTANGFCLLLPASLLDKVLKKLQMYVLRSAVKLVDQRQQWAVYGLQTQASANPEEPVFSVNQADFITIKLPSVLSRYLMIRPIQSPSSVNQVSNDDAWRYQDIVDGLPWFEFEQSEQYTPQMLNIDQLGGISFTKGCYTGQEIVARTHYLGKAKRSLFAGQSNQLLALPCEGFVVLDSQTQQTVGHVLTAQHYLQQTYLLIVLQVADVDSPSLVLDDQQRSVITLIASELNHD
jgi:folate-binding protein YgfZ